MRTLETSEYNLQHMQELVRAQWVSKGLKDKAAFLLEDYKKSKHYSDGFRMAIADSYTNDLMMDYTNEFKILRGAK